VSKKGKVLAIDFGEKNVGLAISDSAKGIVFPFNTIKNFGSIGKLVFYLVEICKKEDVEKIVFGVPMGFNGSSRQEERYKKMGKKIIEKIREGIPDIDYDVIDESFSSYDSSTMVKKNKISDHELAAMRILKKYLKI